MQLTIESTTAPTRHITISQSLVDDAQRIQDEFDSVRRAAAKHSERHAAMRDADAVPGSSIAYHRNPVSLESCPEITRQMERDVVDVMRQIATASGYKPGTARSVDVWREFERRTGFDCWKAYVGAFC